MTLTSSFIRTPERISSGVEKRNFDLVRIYCGLCRAWLRRLLMPLVVLRCARKYSHHITMRHGLAYSWFLRACSNWEWLILCVLLWVETESIGLRDNRGTRNIAKRWTSAKLAQLATTDYLATSELSSRRIYTTYCGNCSSCFAFSRTTSIASENATIFGLLLLLPLHKSCSFSVLTSHQLS